MHINMNADITKMHAVILAGDRPGGSSLAQDFCVESSVLIKIHGKSCLQRVIDTLRQSKEISGICVVGEKNLSTQIDSSLQKASKEFSCNWLPPEEGPAASAVTAVSRLENFPCLLTTGDHALLSSETISSFLKMASKTSSDFTVGLVPFANVQNTFPDNKRTLLKFREGVFCGSNLFLIKNKEGIKVLEYWKTVEAMRKKPWKIAQQLGIRCLFSYFIGYLTLRKALRIISQRAGAKLSYTVIADPLAAIDIDTKADYDIAENWLRNEN